MRENRLSTKDPVEEIFVTFDLSQILETNETVTGTPTITPTVVWYDSTEDTTPANILSGGISVSSPLVVQKIVGGVNGNDYKLELDADTSDGRVLIVTAILPVRDK